MCFLICIQAEKKEKDKQNAIIFLKSQTKLEPFKQRFSKVIIVLYIKEVCKKK
jgi:hypothetical protein